MKGKGQPQAGPMHARRARRSFFGKPVQARSVDRLRSNGEKEKGRKKAQGECRGISNLGILMGSCAGLNYAPRGGGRSGAQQNQHVTRPPGPVTPLCAAKMAAAGRAIPADATVQTRAGTGKVLWVPQRPPTYSASLDPHGRLKASPLRTPGGFFCLPYPLRNPSITCSERQKGAVRPPTELSQTINVGVALVGLNEVAD